MFCGACVQDNPTDHKFCGSCGSALTATISPAQQPEQRYSLILTESPQDDFARFRVIKQVAELQRVSEKEAAIQVESAPCIIASVETFAKAETLRHDLQPLGLHLLIRPYGKETLETINGNGKPPTHSDLPEGAVMAELRQLKASQNGLRAIVLRLVVYGVGLVLICGLFRVYYGGGIGVKVVWKESFSFQDTIVNVDDIVGMPRIVVATKHPQVKRQLEDMGIVETEEQAKKRMWDEIDRDTERLLGKYGLNR